MDKIGKVVLKPQQKQNSLTSRPFRQVLGKSMFRKCFALLPNLQGGRAANSIIAYVVCTVRTTIGFATN